MPAWRIADDGIVIAVRVTPRAHRVEMIAGTDDHFVARLTAPPVDGAANAALIALVAQVFAVPRRAVTLLSGDTARVKRLHIAGDTRILAEMAASL
ncbi:MAG: DUF167 domain-containing protein [Sphingomonas sp.]